MTKKIVYEVQLPKSAIIALYAIAIALTANFLKPAIAPGAAWALSYGDKIKVELVTPKYLDVRMF